MMRTILLSLAKVAWVKRAVVAFRPTRAMVAHYVAGETLEDAVRVARALVGQGLLITIDHLGEDTTDEARARQSADEYLTLLARLADEGLADRVEVSVKLSAVGQALPDGNAVAQANLRIICAAARAVGTTVTLDMEDHTTTDATLAALRAVRVDYPETGGVLQAYLKRTPDDLRSLIYGGSRIRLCKGAYDEPADVAHTTKDAIDGAFVECLGLLMRAPGYPMVATHDPAMIRATLGLIGETGRSPDSYEFQMLHGIRPGEQVRLARLGHRVRVYLPYGTDWFGYYMRRLAERPSNLWLFVRSLAGRS